MEASHIYLTIEEVAFEPHSNHMRPAAKSIKSTIPRNISNITKIVSTSNPHTTRSNMSLFGPRFYSAPEPNFSGLFRLIDDFDKYSSQNGPEGSASRHGRHHIPTFTPKFDLRETDAAYELHGELPGIEKQNVHIEFTDPQTIVIRGKVERTHTEGNPPPACSRARRNSHQPTVEDEPEPGSPGSSAQPTPATTVAQTVKSEQQQPQKPSGPKTKYWVSERSIGEFSRTFNFPTRVETDEVKASLDNGVLAVTVPKAKKHESRRITII
ncbi:heat shock protein 30 [Apiospora kogelbergensis]|uniref:Heat shock protein 30 n=1 Tax=Apiospora kogelbergensis TaxID=1337665 RepID=A0AAW0Q8D5_9PEZI